MTETANYYQGLSDEELWREARNTDNLLALEYIRRHSDFEDEIADLQDEIQNLLERDCPSCTDWEKRCDRLEDNISERDESIIREMKRTEEHHAEAEAARAEVAKLKARLHALEEKIWTLTEVKENENG